LQNKKRKEKCSFIKKRVVWDENRNKVGMSMGNSPARAGKLDQEKRRWKKGTLKAPTSMRQRKGF